jgi:hypothetical protein
VPAARCRQEWQCDSVAESRERSGGDGGRAFYGENGTERSVFALPVLVPQALVPYFVSGRFGGAWRSSNLRERRLSPDPGGCAETPVVSDEPRSDFQEETGTVPVLCNDISSAYFFWPTPETKTSW